MKAENGRNHTPRKSEGKCYGARIINHAARAMLKEYGWRDYGSHYSRVFIKHGPVTKKSAGAKRKCFNCRIEGDFRSTNFNKKYIILAHRKRDRYEPKNES